MLREETERESWKCQQPLCKRKRVHWFLNSLINITFCMLQQRNWKYQTVVQVKLRARDALDQQWIPADNLTTLQSGRHSIILGHILVIHIYSILCIQDYCWEDHGYSLVNRLYPDVGQLIDEKFHIAYNLTYNTMATHKDVDTSMLRRAIWNYIHCMFGIRLVCFLMFTKRYFPLD